MDLSKEEKMYNEFIRKHYRRMLLTSNSNIKTDDLTDNEAIEDLSQIFESKKRKTYTFWTKRNIYYIASIAASILLIVGVGIVLNNYGESNNKNNFNSFNDVSTNRRFSKVDSTQSNINSNIELKVAEKIILPEFYSLNQEVFGFNQETERKKLTMEALYEILRNKYPQFDLNNNDNVIIAKIKNTSGTKEFEIEFKIESNQLNILIKYFGKSDENQAIEELRKLKSELEKYFKEIAR